MNVTDFVSSAIFLILLISKLIKRIQIGSKRLKEEGATGSSLEDAGFAPLQNACPPVQKFSVWGTGSRFPGSCLHPEICAPLLKEWGAPATSAVRRPTPVKKI